MSAMFEGQALWFGLPAALGTALFVLKLLLMLVGGDADGGIETDIDGDTSLDSDAAFSVLSVQGVAAFAAGFGWAGLGAQLGMGWSLTVGMACGAAGGVASAWLLGLALKGIYDLQSSGTVSLQDAVGAVGEVYAEVPAQGEGTGQVRLIIDQRQRIVDAVSEGPGLPRSTRIRVVSLADARTVTISAE